MKKIIFIIVLIFIIILGGIGYYVYINNGSQTADSGKIFNNVKNFFPFGTPSTQTEPLNINNSATTEEIPGVQPKKIDRLFQISEAPIAGYMATDTISTSTEFFFNKEKNATTSSSTKKTETYVRFVERATGHILESKISTLEKTRISNLTIPKVYEAYLNTKGAEFITRTLSGENIITEYRKINTGTSTASSSQTIYYPTSTDIFIVRGDSVFYTTRTSSGSIGYLSTFDNKKPTQLFTTQLRDISASWSGGNIIEIFSKPNSKYEGISFVVDIKKQTIKQNFSGILGLTTSPSRDGVYSIYNTNIENLNLGSKKIGTNIATYLSAKTLPEKCVWSKKETKIIYCAITNYFERVGYPERWYQGTTFFNDEFWKINVETGEQSRIYSPSFDGKASPDATNLTLNEKENYLFFINKKDLTLWGLSL